MDETFRVSGIEVRLTPTGDIWHEGTHLGRVTREKRFEQWFWRAYYGESPEPLKRFLTARHEAVQLLLLRWELVDGIGF